MRRWRGRSFIASIPLCTRFSTTLLELRRIAQHSGVVGGEIETDFAVALDLGSGDAQHLQNDFVDVDHLLDLRSLLRESPQGTNDLVGARDAGLDFGQHAQRFAMSVRRGSASEGRRRRLRQSQTRLAELVRDGGGNTAEESETGILFEFGSRRQAPARCASEARFPADFV